MLKPHTEYFESVAPRLQRGAKAAPRTRTWRRRRPPTPNGSFQHFHVCGATQRGDTLVSSSETSLTGLDCLTGARHALIGRDFLPGRLA